VVRRSSEVKAYVLGTDGRLRVSDWGGPVAAGWSSWKPLPGLPGGRRIASEPGAGDREDAVYVANTDGAGWRWSASWSGIGGRFLSAPASVTQVHDTIPVTWIFGRGTNGQLYYRNYLTSTVLGNR
jgi:hypothetical protein